MIIVKRNENLIKIRFTIFFFILQIFNFQKANTEDNDEWCAPSSIKNLKDLTSHTINCLSEDQPEYKLALLLLDACNNLEHEG